MLLIRTLRQAQGTSFLSLSPVLSEVEVKGADYLQ